jgi:hypothetical protein
VISSTSHGHILFAGGCHVNGYPVGESSSFSEITANALDYTCTRIAPIGLSNTSRLFDYLQLHPRPNILVLQFGNYEAPRPLARHFRAVFSSTARLPSTPRSSVSSSQRPWLSLPPDQVFSPTPAWRSRVLLKQAYAIAAQRVEPPLFDAAAIRLKLRTLLTRIAAYEIPVTIVLTPLPCADHMARSFRVAAAPIFHEQAAVAGLLSLDTAAALGYIDRSSKRSFDIYADERHLNLCGHQFLADALTRLLKPDVPYPVPSASNLEGMHV